MGVEFPGHDMRRKSALGLGSWDQCENCGATKHGGYWWLAGYKSKAEPKCLSYGVDGQWKNVATEVDMNGVKG